MGRIMYSGNLKEKNRCKRKLSEGRKQAGGILAGCIIAALGLACSMPVLLLAAGSLADSVEWKERLEPLVRGTDGYIRWKWIPDFPTAEHYKRLLFYSPQFMVLFWNSIKMTGEILAGQLLIAVPGAWAFGVCRFRGKKLLFSLYVILMLLPFQVTLLSKYLVLTGLGLMNTQAAVVLPAIFSTFPVFLIYRSFSAIPAELLEAARIDGAGELQIFCQIGIPAAGSGILAAMVLGFLECWNMMEEPLAFLRDKALWPLSLYLPEISVEQAGFACAASMVTLLVSLFVFAIFKDTLEQGIISSGLK